MAQTMVGTKTPQKLFSDLPANNFPGAVTPNITVAMPNYADGVDAAAQWARAAAINNANFARQARNTGGGWNRGDVRAPTASQSSGMGAQYRDTTAGTPGVMWAPRNLQGPQLGTWADQQQKKAIAENKRPPMILQAYADDPYSPGEVGGGITSSRGLYGPGLTSPIGTSNPAIWAKMWKDRNGGGE